MRERVISDIAAAMLPPARREPNEIYGLDVEAARNVLKRYRKGKWHINGAIVREALDAAYSAKRDEREAKLRALCAKAEECPQYSCHYHCVTVDEIRAIYPEWEKQ